MKSLFRYNSLLAACSHSEGVGPQQANLLCGHEPLSKSDAVLVGTGQTLSHTLSYARSWGLRVGRWHTPALWLRDIQEVLASLAVAPLLCNGDSSLLEDHAWQPTAVTECSSPHAVVTPCSYLIPFPYFGFSTSFSLRITLPPFLLSCYREVFPTPGQIQHCLCNFT